MLVLFIHATSRSQTRHGDGDYRNSPWKQSGWPGSFVPFLEAAVSLGAYNTIRSRTPTLTLLAELSESKSEITSETLSF